MARSDKDINIPFGPEKQAEDIREALMEKIKQQEQLSQTAAQGQSQQYQQQPNNPAQQDAPNPYTQNPYASQLNQIQYNQPPSAAQNQYAGYGAYTSPFNNQPSQSVSDHPNNLVDAIHASSSVQYKPKKRKSAAKTLLILLIMVAIIFGLSWALREFVFQAYEIPSGSMEETIMTGDMVFAEKISPRTSAPLRGDIVTFDDPLNEGRILIKRVIATGGQTVDIKDNKLFVDGVEQDEPYVKGLPTTEIARSKITYPYTVPDDCVWLMGDNRTNSQDSRYFGAVPQSSIIGKALFIYWPFDDFKVLE